MKKFTEWLKFFEKNKNIKEYKYSISSNESEYKTKLILNKDIFIPKK